MAADNYDETGGNNPGIAPDWWFQNQPTQQPPQPTPPPSAPPAPTGLITREDGSYQDPKDGSWHFKDGTPFPAGPLEWTGEHIGDQNRHPTPLPDQQITWGGPVSPFNGMQYPTFTPPPLPDYLQKGFALPSADELQNTPGYMARFQQGLNARQRSAASRGTILNGGTQQALDRYGQDYASGEYGNLVNQKLNERQQQSSDYLNLAYGPAWQSNQAAVNQYGQLYRQYADSVGNNRNSQNDYWNQQMQLLNAGLDAARSGSPGSTGGQG